MIMHAGLRYGAKKSILHFFGIMFGVGLMLFMVSYGFGYFFDRIPNLNRMIANLGTLDMIYLARVMSKSKTEQVDVDADPPITFFRAALFQWVNPQVWFACLTLSTMYHVFDVVLLNALALTLCVMIINIPCHILWLSAGRLVDKFIKTEKQRKILNYVFSFLLLLCIIILWI